MEGQGAGQEELISAFDKLRDKQMGMSPEEFNDDNTLKAVMTEVGGGGRPYQVLGSADGSVSSAIKISYPQAHMSNTATYLCVDGVPILMPYGQENLLMGMRMILEMTIKTLLVVR